MSTRSYSDAVDALNSLQSNTAVLEALRASGNNMSLRSIPEMLEYLHRIGYSASDLNKLNVIHVTGTKGKGSTSAFTDSILRQVKPEWKIGLYTSPHLVAVRERIRINSVPLSEEQFSSFFFEVWDRLEENRERALDFTSLRPAYFRMMTLVAFHAFLSLGVDATILEVGVGGAYDSTNVVPKPVVTGVTALGLDHVSVLGNTIGLIAWQKAGIYKEGAPALTVEQPEEGMTVLEQVAEEKKASSFSVVKRIPETDDIKLGIAGSHQYQNAALAVELSRTFFRSKANLQFDEPLPELFRQGLIKTRWPGRCQTVGDPTHPQTTWFLDGAHTHESLEYTVRWFVAPDTALREKRKNLRVLIFNCTSGRSGSSFLESVLKNVTEQLESHKSEEKSSAFFDTVVFCANVTYANGRFKGVSRQLDTADADLLKTQNQLADAWSSLIPDFPTRKIHVLPSIEHAVRMIRGIESERGGSVDVLVTGSLLLVGGVVEVAGLVDVAL